MQKIILLSILTVKLFALTGNPMDFSNVKNLGNPISPYSLITTSYSNKQKYNSKPTVSKEQHEKALKDTFSFAGALSLFGLSFIFRREVKKKLTFS